MPNSPLRARKRRAPRQLRAQQTVATVLDAVARVLKRHGVKGLTTNRIAEAAGVSIGSIYQYFPDKRAILIALRDRHVAAMGSLIEGKLVAQADAPLAQMLRGLIDAMIEAHALDPVLYELLLSQLPQTVDSALETRLSGALKLALASRAHEFTRPPDATRVLFVLRELLETLAHACVLRRPEGLSLRAAKDEAAQAVLAYLGAHGWVATPRPRRTSSRHSASTHVRRPQ